MDDPDKSVSGGISAIPAGVRSRLTASQKSRELQKRQTLRGIVREGVERGAVVLLDDRGMLLAQLMGGDPAVLTDGARVEVTGAFRRDLSTTAQQGPPFQVESANTLDTPRGR